MLQLLPCPHCGQNSLISAETSLEATVACPHCQQKLVLAEVLLGQFASWEILDDPLAEGIPTPSKLRPGVVVPVPSPEDTHTDLSLAEEADPLPAMAVSTGDFTRLRSFGDVTFRPRRKTKSPLKSILPVVLGGVAAGPIALLILWHILGKDVGNLGPQVANYVPWIVPKKFHPVSTVEKRIPRPGESGFRNFTKESPAPKPAPALVSSNPTPSPNLAQPLPRPDDQSTVGSSQSADRSQPPLNDDLEPSMRNAPKSSEITPITPAEEAAANASVKPTGDVFSKIHQTSEWLNKLGQALESDLLERKKETFSQSHTLLSELTVELAGQNKDSPNYRAIQQELQSMTAVVKNSPALQDVFNQYMKYISASLDLSHSTPVALTLEVSSAELLSSRWLVTGVQPLHPNLVIEVPRTVTAAIPSNSKWFVLGIVHKSETEGLALVLVVEYMRQL